MALSRMLRHLLTPHWRLRRSFPAATQSAIEKAIQASEHQHGGQIRFAVESTLPSAQLWRGQTPRERAIEVFAQLGVWDTEHNNGVLIYLLLADRAVEIVADRGVSRHVSAQAWAGICRDMETAYRAGSYQAGSVAGIAAVTHCLAEHFPPHAGGRNELPDKPVLL